MTGLPAAPGIGIGRAWLWRAAPEQAPAAEAAAGAAQREVSPAERFRQVQQAVVQALTAERDQLASRAGAAAAGILAAHALLVEDPLLEEAVLERVAAGQSLAAAVTAAGDQLAAQLAQSDDETFRLRADDLRDVAARLVRALRGQVALPLAPWPDAVAVVEELLPSQVAHLAGQGVAAVAAVRGGVTSHAAVLCRAAGIPAVFGLDGLTGAVQDGDWMVVDGDAGQVQLHPDAQQLARARRLQERQAAEAGELAALRELPAVTADGRRRIQLAANLGHPDELDQALAAGAEAVGLFRSEFLFLDRPDLPGEEEQYQAYRRVLRGMAGRPVVIRTLDVGGDKPLAGVRMPAEQNPFLGQRGVRLWLTREELWRPQLRALLRAADEGELLIMLPMVTAPSEVVRARALIERVAADLGGPPRPCRLGVMIEVPAAALAAQTLARVSDFFSLGTNDLTQYALAVDRQNPAVAHLYQPLHPGMLALMQAAVQAAHRAGIWCGICGELAGDTAATAVLVGLGVDELSVAPRRLGRVKAAIRSITLDQAEAAARRALDPLA